MTCVQWYQLGNLDQPAPTLLSHNTIGSPDQNRYFPSLAVDSNGTLALGYAYSSSTDYAGVRYTGDGTLGGEGVLRAGLGPVDGTRYGDYADTAVDPHDHLTIWHFEEYAADPRGSGTWGTWIGAFQVSSPVPAADFSLGASPGSQTVLPGASPSYTVTMSAINGFSGSVALSVSGLPSGASASFSPGAISATSPTSTLTVATSAATRGGVYTLTITATGGGITHSTSVTLTVMDFSVSVSPSSQTVRRGGSTSYTVTVSSINGYSSPVTFALSPLPLGVTASGLPSTATPPASFTLSIKTSSNTPKQQTYTLTIRATGAGANTTLTRSASFQLRVRN